MAEQVRSEHYIRALQQWVRASEPHFYVCPDRPELVCYGTGYNGWGVQTNQKALAALAVLAADPDFDEARAGVSRERVADWALAMLRFSLESHVEGSYHCTDGTQWGHTWISALGVERMMHGLEAIDERLTDHDRELLRKVLVSECDWLVDQYEVEAGPVENNVPESNLWNGAICHRTAATWPDLPRAAEYREKGSRFLVNAISVAADAASEVVVDGRAVKDWHVGANFFDSYALNHHRYLNVGYMVICLSNAAMLHFFYRTRGQEAPEALYHHVEDLWPLVKQCTFSDGRLCRIGGDTRVRYCYCQDYGVPSWLLMLDRYGDGDCVAFERGWLGLVATELAANGDGAFLSQRCEQLAKASPLYYTRIEADRAVTLSMGAYWRRVLELACDVPAEPAGGEATFAWHDDYHGALLQRGPRRIASFVWDAAEPPQGMCLPPDRSDLAEWKENLAGTVVGEGRIASGRVTDHHEVRFDGGFLTWGTAVIRSKGMVSEGMPDEPVATLRLAFAALPDDRTVMVFQQARSPARRVFLQAIGGIGLRVPNDLFTGGRRVYHAAFGKTVLAAIGDGPETLKLHSRWVNVDDCLSLVGVCGVEQLAIERPGRRQIGLRGGSARRADPAGGMLCADEICWPCWSGLASADANTVLFDVGVLVMASVDHAATAEYVESGRCRPLYPSDPDVRAMIAAGADGAAYLLVASFADREATAELDVGPGVKATDLAGGETLTSDGGRLRVDLAGAGARLLRLDGGCAGTVGGRTDRR